MHDGDKLRSELGLYITDDVFNCRGDGVLSRERGVHNDAETFHL